jgi:hypothetical protein
MRIKKIGIIAFLFLISSCSSNYQYKPYREHGFTCTEMGEPNDLKCIEIDSDFDGTDLHKEYEVDYNSWGDLR